jgi:hypothetical protein
VHARASKEDRVQQNPERKKERKKIGERERERERERGRNERDRERLKKEDPREREGSGARCIDERGVRRGMLGGVRTGRFLRLR